MLMLACRKLLEKLEKKSDGFNFKDSMPNSAQVDNACHREENKNNQQDSDRHYQHESNNVLMHAELLSDALVFFFKFNNGGNGLAPEQNTRH